MNSELLKMNASQSSVEANCWEGLKEFTDARIALGRCGASMPTSENLAFSLAHARARDAVHQPFAYTKIEAQLREMGLESVTVKSAATSRSTFLTRPDMGRKLSDESREKLEALNSLGFDMVIVIGDGLSSKAVHKQAVPLIHHLLPYIKQLKLSLAPIVLAEQCRVALGDEVNQILKGKIVAMLIGERPGLSSPDSLGVYMTYDSYVGRLESERNCISNIRPEGLSYPKAAFKLAWLIESALTLNVSGIALKDDSDNPDSYRTLKPTEMVIL